MEITNTIKKEERKREPIRMIILILILVAFVITDLLFFKLFRIANVYKVEFDNDPLLFGAKKYNVSSCFCTADYGTLSFGNNSSNVNILLKGRQP